MLGKIKIFLSNFLEFKKTVFLALLNVRYFRFLLLAGFLFFLLLGLTLPIQSAQAFILKLGALPAMGIIIAGLQLLVAATGALVELATIFLSWVLSPGFINLPYTRGGIVDLGYPLVRDLSNMIIVLALVVIGLATILRIEEYKAQKTLPVLIIVALLINFSPVICGLIIDATNIVMNFFLQGIKDINHLSLGLRVIWGGIVDALGKVGIIDFLKLLGIGLVLKPIAISLFNLGAALVLFLYAFVLLFRYVALWILVILSPLAFACYILPGTRGVFRMWWSQFLQWAIIGIALLFFLWLGWQMLELTKGGFLPPPTEGTKEVDVAFFADLFPYAVFLALLLLGFFVGLSTGAMGASQAIRGGKWVGTKVGKFTLGTARGVPAISRAEEAVRRRMERMPILGRIVGGPGAMEAERGREMEAARKRIEAIRDTPAGNEDIRKRIARTPMNLKERYDRAAGVEILAKRKELTDEVAKFIPEAQKRGADVSAIYKARPDAASNLTVIDPQTKKPRPMKVEEAMAKIEPGDFWKTVQEEALKNPEVVLHASLDERKFELMARHMKPELKRVFKTTFQTHPQLALANIPPQYQGEMIKRALKLSADPRWQV